MLVFHEYIFQFFTNNALPASNSVDRQNFIGKSVQHDHFNEKTQCSLSWRKITRSLCTSVVPVSTLAVGNFLFFCFWSFCFVFFFFFFSRKTYFHFLTKLHTPVDQL